MKIILELTNVRELKMVEEALLAYAEDQDKFGEEEDGDYDLLDHAIDQVNQALEKVTC